MAVRIILFPVDFSGGHPHKEGTEPEVKGQEGGKQVAEVFLHLTLFKGLFPLIPTLNTNSHHRDRVAVGGGEDFAADGTAEGDRGGHKSFLILI